MKSPRFIYVRDKSKLFGPALTIAVDYDEEEACVVYSIAVCSKKDRFSKKIGREVALGRLSGGMSDYLFIDDLDPGYPIGERLYEAMRSAFNYDLFDWDMLGIDFPDHLDMKCIKDPTLSPNLKWDAEGKLTNETTSISQPSYS